MRFCELGRSAAFVAARAAAVAAGLALAGCAKEGLVASVGIATLDPDRVTLGIAGIYGPPGDLAGQFNRVLAEEAKARGFVVPPQGGLAPATRLNAYLDATRTPDGKPAIAWVINSYADRRIARSSGAVPVNPRDASPWSGLDGPTMRRIAGQGLDDLSRVLTTGAITPAGLEPEAEAVEPPG